jgi:radical SAM superfamily enzyme YgiQ (UPF0313 family)
MKELGETIRAMYKPVRANNRSGCLTALTSFCETRNRMRLLLINPWIADIAAYDFWLKPVGLLILARRLKDSGHDLRWLDCLDRYNPDLQAFNSYRVRSKNDGTGKFFSHEIEKPDSIAWLPRRYKLYGLPYELVVSNLKRIKQEFDPEAVFITSAMTYWYPAIWKMIALVRNILPGSRILLGGVYPVLLPIHALKSGADAVCTQTDPDSVRQFLGTQGICLKEEEGSLLPDYEVYTHPMSHLVYLSSVGCPYRCSYCATPTIQKFFRQPCESLAEQMRRDSDRLKCPNIAFFDDAILVDHEIHMDVLLEMLIKAGLPQKGVALHIPNGIHARLLHRETARLLKLANVKTLKIGLETLDMELQKKTGAKVTTEDFIKSVRILKDAGFTGNEVSAYIMINLPGQKEEDLHESVRLCHELGIRVNINEYTPIPRTVEYQRLVDAGTFSEDIDPVLLNNSILPYWWKNGMSFDQITRIKKSNRKYLG